MLRHLSGKMSCLKDKYKHVMYIYILHSSLYLSVLYMYCMLAIAQYILLYSLYLHTKYSYWVNFWYTGWQK